MDITGIITYPGCNCSICKLYEEYKAECSRYTDEEDEIISQALQQMVLEYRKVDIGLLSYNALRLIKKEQNLLDKIQEKIDEAVVDSFYSSDIDELIQYYDIDESLPDDEKLDIIFEKFYESCIDDIYKIDLHVFISYQQHNNERYYYIEGFVNISGFWFWGYESRLIDDLYIKIESDELENIVGDFINKIKAEYIINII